MSVSSLYYLHGIQTPSGTLISQLQDTSPQISTQYISGLAAGHPEPLWIGRSNQTVEVTFTTTACKQVLDLINGGGNPYALALSGNIDLLYRKGVASGFREASASTVHYRLRATRGILYWRTIRAAHGQEATLACRILLAYDGTNPPLVPAGSLALSGTPAFSQAYTLGPVAINGSAMGGVQEWSLSLNEQAEQLGSDGEIWPSWTGLKSVAPSATIRAVCDPLYGLAIAGSALSSGLSLYLRARAQNAGNVAAASASHILITGNGGTIGPDGTSGGGNDPAETTLAAQLSAASATTYAITLNTASTVPF